MKKEEMEQILSEMQIDKRVAKQVRYHCIAFWSTILGMSSLLGSWVSANVDAFSAALKVFINVWMSK